MSFACLLLRKPTHFLTWRGITSCSFDCTLNPAAFILVISHAYRQLYPAEKLSAPANFNLTTKKITLTAGKNVSWRNLETRYEITTACPQARDCTKPGCAKDILWAASGTRMWPQIKAPVCKGCGQTVGCVPSGRRPSGPLAQHAPPASLLPLSWIPEGSPRKSKLIPLHKSAKLKSVQPPKGNIYKHRQNIQRSTSHVSRC